MTTRPYRMIRLDERELDPPSPGDEPPALPRRVATITLNNPARRNAIGPRMVNELLYALGDATEDQAVRAVVLTGEGKAFCAGGDFAQMTGGADGETLPPKGDYADLMRTMVRYPKPLLARVNGHAMGGGLGLVAACHYAIGNAEAKLGTPEVNVGLFPMMIMAVLRRIMPHRRMVQMMTLGERLSGDEAVAAGLLNRAVPLAQLDDAVEELLEALSTKSPLTLTLGLEALAAQEHLDLEPALELLRERLGACLATDDAREGLTAFLAKRSPKWTGR